MGVALCMRTDLYPRTDLYLHTTEKKIGSSGTYLFSLVYILEMPWRYRRRRKCELRSQLFADIIPLHFPARRLGRTSEIKGTAFDSVGFLSVLANIRKVHKSSERFILQTSSNYKMISQKSNPPMTLAKRFVLLG